MNRTVLLYISCAMLLFFLSYVGYFDVFGEPMERFKATMNSHDFDINETITFRCNIPDYILQDSDWKKAYILENPTVVGGAVTIPITDTVTTVPASIFLAGFNYGQCITINHIEDPINAHYHHSNEIRFRITGELLPEPITANDTITLTKKNGGCADCISPTIGKDVNGKRFVDYGLVLNDTPYQVEILKTHTEMQYTTLGKENHLQVKIYDNQGSRNIDFVQFALVKEIGVSMNIHEPRIEIDLKHNIIQEIKLLDKNGIINNYRVDVSIADCMEGYTHQCLKLDIYWTFDKVPKYKVLNINGWDKAGNSFNNYFNDGLTVIDPNYVEPAPVEPYKYECITPDVLPMDGGDRNDCWWRALYMGWLYN